MKKRRYIEFNKDGAPPPPTPVDEPPQKQTNTAAENIENIELAYNALMQFRAAPAFRFVGGVPFVDSPFLPPPVPVPYSRQLPEINEQWGVDILADAAATPTITTFGTQPTYEGVESSYTLDVYPPEADEPPLIRRVRAILIADDAAENTPTPVNTWPINSLKGWEWRMLDEYTNDYVDRRADALTPERENIICLVCDSCIFKDVVYEK